MSGPQVISKVAEVGILPGGRHWFVLQNIPGIEFQVHEEDEGRIERGDVVCIEVVTDIYPWNGDPSVFTEADRTKYKLIRVTKGGDPAFQG